MAGTDHRGKLEEMLCRLFEERRIDPALLADDAEWVNPHDAIEPGTRCGATEFNAAIASVFATWDEVHFNVDRVIPNGDEPIALGTLCGRLHDAGMAIDHPHAQIWTFRSGLVARMQWFNSHREALERAGVRE